MERSPAGRPKGCLSRGREVRLALAAVIIVGAAAGCARPEGPPAAGGAAVGTTATPAAAPPVVAELARAARGRGRRVLFVGLDGGDWQLLDGYMADGTMPNLAGLTREGVSGVLETIQPPLSPLVWTTMMTGVSPLEHRVLDFTRFDPATGALEPITSDERRVPAVWNMASAAGRTVAVLGLWATWPAEPVRGLLVADRLASFTTADRQPPPGVVFPPAREPWARRELAAAGRETGFEAVHAYLPWLDAAEYRRQTSDPAPYAHPASALRRILVETRAWDALARSWIERARPDLAIVYFQGTDTLGHMFAPYAPPCPAGVAADDCRRYGDVPRRYFAEIDRLLGRFRDLAAREDAVLFVASDHGFRWREGRPAGGGRAGAAVAATAALWHREEGIYLLWAPDAADVTSRRARPAPRGRGGVAQVCATLLDLLGLPPGTGLAPALDAAGAFARGGRRQGGGERMAQVRAVDYRRWFQPPPVVAPPMAGTADRPAGVDQGAAPGGPATSGRAAGISASGRSRAPEDEQIAALRALGYVGAGEPGRRAGPGPAGGESGAAGAVTAGAAATRTAAAFDNEGLLLRQAGRATEARAAFEQALARQPGLPAALWNLSDLLFAEAQGAGGAGGPGHAPGAGEQTAAGAPGRRTGTDRRVLLDRSDELLLRALAGGLPGGAEHALERAARYGRAGDGERALALLGRAAAARPADPRLWLLHGRYLLEQRRCDAALDDFTHAVRLDPTSAVAHASAGLACLCRGDEPAARAAFRRSLALDPDQPEIRRFLAHE
jgi:tetratricopeptide (TPR) repeat protein